MAAAEIAFPAVVFMGTWAMLAAPLPLGSRSWGFAILLTLLGELDAQNNGEKTAFGFFSRECRK